MKFSRITIITLMAASLALVGCKAKEESQNVEVTSEPVENPVSIPGITNDTVDPDSKVVSVNGESLTRGELDQELDMITASPQFAGMPPQQADMIRQQMESRVVDRFVSQKVLSAAAEAENVEATDAEVDEFIDGIRSTIPEGMTLEGIMEERGIAMDKLRSDVTADIKIRKLLEAKTAAISDASDDDVAAYYEANKEMFSLPESVRARHILVKVDADADEAAKAAAKQKLEALHKQIEAGEISFEEAAKANSDCPSGQRGGDLGTFSHGQMVPPFEQAAFSQAIDELGPVIETSFGYHIVQVTEKNEAGERSLEDASDEIKEQLTNEAKQNVVQDYIEGLRADADITYGDE